MNNTLRWVKFESVMTANFAVSGIAAPKFNRFRRNHISLLENS
jgi:hypothetical protein